MAVKHTIRKDGEENFKTVRLTSLKAIRAFCLECVGWSSDEVYKCTAPNCPLFPFRFGIDPSSTQLKSGSKRSLRVLKGLHSQQTALH
jgi:hypothetical protein